MKRTSFRGWWVLAGAMFAYGGICGNLTYAYGVFLPSMSESFHWSRSALSGPYTLFLIIGGMLGPLAGHTIDRYGARINIIIGNTLAAFGLLAMSQVSAIWQVYLFFGVLGGLALAFAEFLPVTTVITHWFIKKRSLALGLLFASGGIGGFFLPPFISSLIFAMGWSWTWVCLAAIHLLFTVILAGILIRNRPEEEGQVPDGGTEASLLDRFHAPAHSRLYATMKDWKASDALRTGALWKLLLMFSIILFTTNMMSTHQVAYLLDLNYSPFASATALGSMLGASIFGRLLSGLLGMRFEGRYLAAVFLACMGLGVVSLMSVGGIKFVYLYSALTGIGFGGMIVLLPNVMGAYFGRTHFSRIVGWTTPVVTLIAAASPMLAGFLYDATGSYFIPFAVAAVLLFGCSLMALFTHPPRLPEVGKYKDASFSKS